MAHGIIKHPDNTVAVVHLSPEALAFYATQGLDADQAVAKEVAKLKTRGDLQASCEHIASNIDLPQDREFRKAWRWLQETPEIDICPHTAAEVVKDKLREERAPKLAELDIAYQRADEAGDTSKKQEVAAKKQALRDITATVPIPAEDMVIADEEFLNTLRAIKLPE